ncbi:MAG: hypothetical protein WBB31_12005 [Saprospiraceae bacterium]
MTPQTDIQTYLSQLKTKLGVFGIVFRNREKNLNALAELDIAPIQREDCLKDLRPEDYCSGPNIDKDVPGRPDYYEFGIIVNGKEVYIKLSMGFPNKPVDCISFHVAEWPMKYPLKPTTS